MKPREPKDWSEARAKVAREGRCRVCGRTVDEVHVEAAHVLGQRYDRDNRVRSVDVVPLCGDCHRGPEGYDAHELNLRPYLRAPELAAAVQLVGEGPALRRIMGKFWRDTVDTTPR